MIERILELFLRVTVLFVAYCIVSVVVWFLWNAVATDMGLRTLTYGQTLCLYILSRIVLRIDAKDD